MVIQMMMKWMDNSKAQKNPIRVDKTAPEKVLKTRLTFEVPFNNIPSIQSRKNQQCLIKNCLSDQAFGGGKQAEEVENLDAYDSKLTFPKYKYPTLDLLNE